MPVLLPFLPLIAGIGGSVASAAINRRGSTNKNTRTTRGGPVLNAEEQRLESSLIGSAQSALDSPVPLFTKSAQAFRNQSVTNVNRATDFAGQRLETKLAGRGFGRSGLVAAGKNELEVGRINAISNIEAQIIQFSQQVDQRQRNFQNALSLLPQGSGQFGFQNEQQGFGRQQQPFDLGGLFGNLSNALGQFDFGGGGQANDRSQTSTTLDFDFLR